MPRILLGLIICTGALVGTDLVGATAQLADLNAKTSANAISEATRGMSRLDGFVTVYRNDQSGELFFEVPSAGMPDVLLQASLASGIGRREISIGGVSLDRGFLGDSHLVTFRRFGGNVLVIERNTNYFNPAAGLGAIGDADLSFSGATIASLQIKAEEGGRLLLDASTLFRRDDIDIPSALKAANQGSYSLEPSLTALDLGSARVSDRSMEVETVLTFKAGDQAPDKDLLSNVVANRASLRLREHFSLIKLDDLKASTYRSRAFDPRSGYFDLTYYDPSRRIDQPLRRSYIIRHRLIKKMPEEATSDPEQPIVLYIDPSVPAALHPLVVEAALWWNPAFEAAGFRNAIQVKELPADLAPLAAGVNIIFWIPRATRGWSFGSAVVDPRTGEILKTIVRLDGMRLRADQLLFDALTAPYTDHPDLAARDDALRQRFKLLVAHEIGHTLGLRHQFIGSAQGISSVMDYPFPKIGLGMDGVPGLGDVFPNGIGSWDRSAIMYGYRPFAPDDEAVQLRRIIEQAGRNGLYWMTDDDTDASPYAQKWDSGTDPVAELKKVLELRRAALRHFSRTVVPMGEPLSGLQDALVPIYLLHQFEVKAVAAMLGGFVYHHAMRDEAGPVPIPPDMQRNALDALLATLDPETLGLDKQILALLAPRPPSYPANAESFGGKTGNIFDALQPAKDAVSIVMQEILTPSRASRLAQASARDTDAVALREVLRAVVNRTWHADPRDGAIGDAQRAIARTVIQSILTAIARRETSDEVRGECWLAIDELLGWMKVHPASAEWQATYAFVEHAIASFEQDPTRFAPPAPTVPMLDPMGWADDL